MLGTHAGTTLHLTAHKTLKEHQCNQAQDEIHVRYSSRLFKIHVKVEGFGVKYYISRSFYLNFVAN